ncbi:hypothetical protein FACS1894211_06500 [Clostridia bacterium]|nr:hypothetical protein FACS1894211_06500 [Clostridia bacterium]
MEKEKRMERNLGAVSLRITEIPSYNEYHTIECPRCQTTLTVRIGDGVVCEDLVTVCKRCKRTLKISAKKDAP